MSFSEQEIRSIVRTGQLTDPAAEAYLVNTLVARRDKIGRAWMTRFSSFNEFRLTKSGELKFEHLASFYDFARRPDHQISWFSFDNASGKRLPIDGFRPNEDEGYFVAVVSSIEGCVDVFLRSQHGNAQIVGIERQ